DRKRAERAHHVYFVPETIHVLELPVEVEPFRPGVQRWASLMSHIVVPAAAVRFRMRIPAPFAKLLKDLPQPPVEMGVDDSHSTTAKSYYTSVCPDCSRATGPLGRSLTGRRFHVDADEESECPRCWNLINLLDGRRV